MKETHISKPILRKMVILFYTRVLKDDLIAHFFIDKLGDNLAGEIWGKHLDILTNFWASK